MFAGFPGYSGMYRLLWSGLIYPKSANYLDHQRSPTLHSPCFFPLPLSIGAMPHEHPSRVFGGGRSSPVGPAPAGNHQSLLPPPQAVPIRPVHLPFTLSRRLRACNDTLRDYVSKRLPLLADRPVEWGLSL